MNQMSRFKII